MAKVSIGIEKRVSLPILELALRAVLDGSASSDYFMELALAGCTGPNRAKKSVALLNRLTIKSKLLPYIEQYPEQVNNMLRSSMDKPLLFSAMMCSAYTLFYDTVALLGKYFHVQETVSRSFLLQKLSEKYGSNRTLDVAFDCVMPMLIETGIVKRSELGVYAMVRQEKYSDHAAAIYKQAFLLNNPNFSEKDNVEGHPFFEFIK